MSFVIDPGATTVSLPDHLTLADGSTYQFTYEPTFNNHNNVTGRLASVTLPTGGVISYAYSAGCGAGINPDGTVCSLTRTPYYGNYAYAAYMRGAGYLFLRR